MDKRVIFAVAGAGKTTQIVSQLSDTDACLILTYTRTNLENIRRAVIRRFGYFPTTITLDTYFSFLFSFCIRPLLSLADRPAGLFFETNPNFYASGDARYLTRSGYLYANRAAKFIEHRNLQDAVIRRMQKYFNAVFVDEVQDFAGNDFNFLKVICRANLKTIFVGDFYQHTFDTSRDGGVNKTLHDDLESYQKHFKKMGLEVDNTTLTKSWRCSPDTCNFISEKLDIMIESNRVDKTDIFLIDGIEEAQMFFEESDIVKLFYRQHYLYPCFSRNWGDCKGEDSFGDVCVVLNADTDKKFRQGKLRDLNPQTRNKLYVACSRARGNLYFVSEALIRTMLQR